jgi:hypothetical protein
VVPIARFRALAPGSRSILRPSWKASHEVTAGRCLPAPPGRPLLRAARKQGFSVVSLAFSRLSSARLRSRRKQHSSVGEAASGSPNKHWKAADHRGDAEKFWRRRHGSGASNSSHRVFRLDTDPPFIALANVADETDLKARGAVNSAKANPAFLLTANNLAAPMTLVSHGSCAQWYEFNGGRFRSFDLCGEGLH